MKADTVLFTEDEIPEGPVASVAEAVKFYNSVARRVNEAAKAIVWCEARVVTVKRRKRFRAALIDFGGVAGFARCLEDASRNPFLTGKEGRTGAHKNWRPDLDFFLQEKTVTRLLEGLYPPEAAERIVIPTVWVPPHVRDAAPFVPEPREVRLAASIVSYRGIGNYARANEIETELALLENRPAVLVPAPDVAHLGMPEKAAVPRAHVIDIVDDYDSIPEGEQYGEEA